MKTRLGIENKGEMWQMLGFWVRGQLQISSLLEQSGCVPACQETLACWTSASVPWKLFNNANMACIASWQTLQPHVTDMYVGIRAGLGLFWIYLSLALLYNVFIQHKATPCYMHMFPGTKPVVISWCNFTIVSLHVTSLVASAHIQLGRRGRGAGAGLADMWQHRRLYHCNSASGGLHVIGCILSYSWCHIPHGTHELNMSLMPTRRKAWVDHSIICLAASSSLSLWSDATAY